MPKIVSLGTQPGTVMVQADDGGLLEISDQDAVAQGLFGKPDPADGVSVSPAEVTAVQPVESVPQAVAERTGSPLADASGAGLADALAGPGIPGQMGEDVLLAQAGDARDLSPEARVELMRQGTEQRAQAGQDFVERFLGGAQSPSGQAAHQRMREQVLSRDAAQVQAEANASADAVSSVDPRVPDPAAAPPPGPLSGTPTGQYSQEELDAANGMMAAGVNGIMAQYGDAAMADARHTQAWQAAWAYALGGGGNPRLARRLMGQLQANTNAANGVERDLTALMERYYSELREGGEIAAGQADTSADMLKQLAIMEGMQEQHRQEREHELQQQVVNETASLERMMDAAREIRLDPNRIFAGSGAARMSAAVSAGVGAALQTAQSIMFPGSNPQNTALDIINQAIDRDIMAQVENYNRGSAEIANQGSLVGMLRQQIGDNDTSFQMARTAMEAQVMLQLQSLAQSTQSETVRNQTQQLITRLQMNWENRRAAAVAGAREQIIAQLRRTRGRGPDLDSLIKLVNNAGSRASSLGSHTLTEEGLRLRAQGGSMTSDMQDAAGAADQIDIFLSEIAHTAQQLERGEITGLQARSRGESIQAAVMTDQNLARITDRDLEYFLTQFPNPFEFTNRMTNYALGTTDASLAQLRRKATNIRDRLRASGPNPESTQEQGPSFSTLEN